jgi:hypothetical protein
MGPDGEMTPGQNGRLTVGRKITLTLTLNKIIWATSRSHKAKPETENIRGLDLAAVKQTTDQATRLPLQRELLRLGHDMLY